MKRLSVFSYILLILFSIAFLSIGTISFFSIKTLSDFIYKEVATNLEQEARLIRNIIPVNLNDSPEPFQQITETFSNALDIRITLITRNGKVLADSHKDYTVMENHSNRPEILTALNGQNGNNIRFSKTLSEHMLYVALPPDNKNIIVRTALSVEHIRSKFLDTFSNIAVFSVIILIVAVLLSILIANRFTSIILEIKSISSHYARGNFSKKLSESGPKEVSLVKQSINIMGDQLKGIIEEVSFQKNELQSMLNSMDDAVLLLDNRYGIQEMNPAAETLFDKKLSDCKKNPINKIIDNEQLNLLIDESVAKSETSKGIIYFNRGLDYYFQMNSTPLKASDNFLGGILVIFHDMTRIKQLEKMRKDFVANVSHELKTPVTLINGFVETLIDGAYKDEVKLDQFLHVISRHSRRITNIIDDLLILSNIEDNGNNISTEIVTLYDILFSAYTSALTESEKFDVNLKVHCNEKLKVTVNPTLVEQAVLNLILNAVKYSGKGSDIFINAKIHNNEIIISVEDNGIGMDSEQLERIFERFYRINRNQSKQKGGTGLGLSIVKHIALAHNGRVSVESQKGEGSIFRIHLPSQVF